MKDLISIIVPVYNAEKKLLRCLKSIAEQTYKNFECIVVDDGSTDSSLSICEEFSSKDNRFKVYHKKNTGVSSTRNYGLKRVTGDWVAFVDSDDWIESSMLEDLSKNATSDSDIIVCDYVVHRFNKIVNTTTDFPQTKNEILLLFITKPGYMNYLWNKLVRRNLYLDNNIIFDENIGLCEDLLVMFNLVLHAREIKHVKLYLYNYDCMSNNSITKKYNMKSFYDRKYVTDKIIELISNDNNISIDSKLLIANFYKVYTKLMLILNKDCRNKKIWKETYPEANKYIKALPLRWDYKIMSWLCSKNLFKLAFFLQDLK